MKKGRTGQGPSGQHTPPIPTREDIKRIRDFLANNPRDLLLFDMATQTGLKMKDLLPLKVEDLEGLRPGDPLPVDSPSKKGRRPPIVSTTIFQTFQRYMDLARLEPGDYIFRSRKGGKPPNISSISNMVKKWFTLVGLSGLAGTRTLRKTYETFFHESRRPAAQPPEDKDALRMLKPVKQESVQELVYQELLKAIASGRISPGERLVTQQIANRLDVSPLPVREALAALEAAGFITSQKKRGVVVNELSKECMEEILAIRLKLEPMAAEFAALRRSEESIEKLEQTYHRYYHSNFPFDREETLRHNKTFHFIIYSQARMPILLQHIGLLWDRVSPYLHILIRHIENYDHTEDIEFHLKMLEGMKRRDPQEVGQWLARDLELNARWVIDNFDKLKTLST